LQSNFITITVTNITAHNANTITKSFFNAVSFAKSNAFFCTDTCAN